MTGTYSKKRNAHIKPKNFIFDKGVNNREV